MKNMLNKAFRPELAEESIMLTPSELETLKERLEYTPTPLEEYLTNAGFYSDSEYLWQNPNGASSWKEQLTEQWAREIEMDVYTQLARLAGWSYYDVPSAIAEQLTKLAAEITTITAN
jgi:hypothetical protein